MGHAAMDLIHIAEAAKQAGVAAQSLYGLTKNGKMFSTSRQGKTFIRRVDLERYIAERERRRAAGVPPTTPYGPISVDPSGERLAPALNADAWEPQEGQAEPEVIEMPLPSAAKEGDLLIATIRPMQPESPYAAMRAKIEHERGAVSHQLQGVSDQIKALEAEAEQLMAQEARLGDMLEKAREVEEFWKTL